MISDIHFVDNGEQISLRDMVYLSIRKAIMNGQLAAGDRIMEIPIAEQLGVSRTPVREAIQRLEKEHLVIVKAGCGARVADIDAKDVMSALDVRINLERMSAYAACKEMSHRDIMELNQINDRLKIAVSQGDIVKIYETDCLFHHTIAEYSGNTVLPKMIDYLEEETSRYRIEHLKNVEERYAMLEEHETILRAMEKHDAELVLKIMENHISKQKKTLIK